MTDVLLATCSALPEGEPGGGLLLDALAARGMSASWAVWDDAGVDWSSARLVAVRSTWDYERQRDRFLGWSEHAERWSRLLHGSFVFAWNTDKRYLLELAGAGVPVVPTLLLDDPARLASVLEGIPGRAVVKPRVAAGGRGLLVVGTDPDLGVPVTPLGEGPWVVQPVVETVSTEGEISVFVLGGVPVSQARKVPASGELRVHEAYGGATRAVPLEDEAMLVASETVAVAQQLLGKELTYARVDLMRLDDGRLVVGELEVTEPGLYLDVLPGNAEAFADAVVRALEG